MSDHTLSIFALSVMACAMLAPIVCAAIAVGNEWLSDESRREAIAEWRPLVLASAAMLVVCVACMAVI